MEYYSAIKEWNTDIVYSMTKLENMFSYYEHPTTELDPQP
jgi:hypothetical protein